jgi:hypothetical protein
MKCEICSAPALPLNGACVFCRSPLGSGSEPPELLAYLADRVPTAVVRRSGLFRRGPIREFRVNAGGKIFRARARKRGVEFVPRLPAGEWTDRLLQALSTAAAGDVELRTRVSRSGWALR